VTNLNLYYNPASIIFNLCHPLVIFCYIVTKLNDFEDVLKIFEILILLKIEIKLMLYTYYINIV